MKRTALAPDNTQYPTEIDSVFRGVRYEIIDRHIVVKGGKDGMLAVALGKVKAFANEIVAIAEVWEGIR